MPSIDARLKSARKALATATEELDAVQRLLSETKALTLDLEGLSVAAKDALLTRGPYVGKPERLVTKEGIVSLIDSQRHLKLKSHLRAHGLTPERYRELFNLPADFPMTPAWFSEHMAESARRNGLGRHKRETPRQVHPNTYYRRAADSLRAQAEPEA